MNIHPIRWRRPRPATAIAAVVALGALGAPAAALAATGPQPATATVTKGSAYTVVESSPGIPTPDQGVLTVSGFPAGALVYAQVCNGVNPAAVVSAGRTYDPNTNCTYANARSVANSSGVVSINTHQASFRFEGPWHGQDPYDRAFNCLAPGDNPTATTTAVGGQPIDRALPSWGSALGGGPAGGGVAACQLRFSTDVGVYQTTDVYVPLTGLDGKTVVKPAISGTPASATAGTAYRYAFTVSGTSPRVTETGALPKGLTLSAAGVLSGTTDVAGSFPISVTATNSVGSATDKVTLRVVPSANRHLVIVAGNNRSVALGGRLTGVTAGVRDVYHNVVPGVRVSVTITGPATFRNGSKTGTFVTGPRGNVVLPAIVPHRVGTFTITVSHRGMHSVTFTEHAIR